ENLLDENEAWKEAIRVDDWVYGAGKPENYPEVKNTRFEQVDTQVLAFMEDTAAADLETKNWSTHEWLHFFDELPRKLTLEQMQDLDKTYKLTVTENSEIASAWFLQAIKSEYETAYPQMEKFLFTVGRGKFLYPLYGEMAKTEKGNAMAKKIYEKSKDNYHPIAQRSIDAI